jgi:type I restriction enzyme S subunit
MRRYDSYKDSGVEWIGEIPSHWEKTKHKFQIDVLSGYPFKSELFDPIEGFPIIRIRDITSGKIETFYTGEVLKDFIITNGDLLVGMDGDFNIRWWDNEDGLLNQRCCSIRERKEVLRRYLYYVLPFQLKIVNHLTYFTTVKHLSVGDIQNTKTILPPLSEQQQIVSYLDTKTSQIDSLIEKTQLKIQLLKENRTSLINEVVTKGLNPNVEMKDSGVEWIGEIPSGWRIVPLKYLGSFQNGISKGSEFFGSGLPFMSYGDVYNNDVTPIELNGKVQIDETEVERYSIKRGDVFFTRTSESKDDIGVCSTCLHSIENSGFSGFVIRFRFYENVHRPEYSRYHFQTHWKKVIIESKMNIVTRSSLSQQVLGDTPVLIPKMKEQNEIVSYLDEHTQLIDKTISVEERRIDTLKEYRQSLISEVVTGKRKVVD